MQLSPARLPSSGVLFDSTALRAPRLVLPRAHGDTQWADMDMCLLQQRFQRTKHPPWERAAAACNVIGVLRVVLSANAVHKSWADIHVRVPLRGEPRLDRAVLAAMTAAIDRRPLQPVRVVCIASTAAEFEACTLALATVLLSD